MASRDTATEAFAGLLARLVVRAGGTAEYTGKALLTGGAIDAPGIVNVALVLDAVERPSDLIAEATGFHRDRPFAFQVPDAWASGVEAELSRRGYREAVRLTAMVLDHAPKQGTPIAGYAMRNVANENDMHAFADIIDQVFSPRTQPGVGTFLFGRRATFAESDTYAVLVRTEDGSPAACGMAILIDGVVGVAMIATLSDHRRRGLGRWATEEVTRQGFAATASRAALLSSPQARSVYAAMGFRKVGEHALFVSETPANA